MVTFDETANQPGRPMGSSTASTTSGVRRKARPSLRQSIAGRMSIILFGREALTFEDQVEGCKCAPMDKAMAHPRKSELMDLEDLEFSKAFGVEEDQPVNSDEAKAKPKSSLFSWITSSRG